MIRNLEVLEGSEGKTPVAEAAPRYSFLPIIRPV